DRRNWRVVECRLDVVVEILPVYFHRPAFALLAVQPFVEEGRESNVRVFKWFAAIPPGQRAAQPFLRVLLRAVKSLVEIVVGAVRPVTTKDADQPLVRAALQYLADAPGLRPGLLGLIGCRFFSVVVGHDDDPFFGLPLFGISIRPFKAI